MASQRTIMNPLKRNLKNWLLRKRKQGFPVGPHGLSCKNVAHDRLNRANFVYLGCSDDNSIEDPTLITLNSQSPVGLKRMGLNVAGLKRFQHSIREQKRQEGGC